MIELKAAPILSSGMTRAVYQHPDHGDRLIKVIRRDFMSDRGVRLADGRKRRWYKFPRRHGIYVTFAREIDEYLAIKSRTSEPIACLQELFGLVETDLGIGLVVEKLCGADGALAPSLRSVVVERGFTPELKQRYQDYLELLYRHDVITSAFDPGNILCAVDRRHGERLVLIDGLGEKSLIPINKLSRALNRRSNLRHWQKTYRKLEAFDRQRPDGSAQRSAAGVRASVSGRTP